MVSGRRLPYHHAMDMLRFWGKAQPRNPDCGPGWHPLAYHSLDVAAVGDVLLAGDRGLGECLSHLLGLPREDAEPLICYLLCLHDIGKFARKFQAKAPRHFPDCFDDDPARLAARYDHGAGGLRLFNVAGESFKFPPGARDRVWRPLVSAVTGHHGSPPEAGTNESAITLRGGDYGPAGMAAASEFMDQAHRLFSLPQDVSALDLRHARRASFAVAGLAVLADWIGSNEEWFAYFEPTQDLETYWSTARERAETAVREAGVLPARANRDVRYRNLIGDPVTPSPMQEWARQVNLPDGPALFMIEDETGSGKTEAALMLAHRIMVSDSADGLYVALPTMATANAMFDRLADAYRHLFAAHARPSIALAHGARDLNARFREAMTRGGRDEESYSGAGSGDEASETTASAACAAWIADDRRRTFLADAGAGTIDQALLSVLPSRHQSLRLLGLMRRVLVLDEVHAYDAFMQREMERLLEFQAGLGGSAILLSATLPLSVRERLSDAFARGMGAGPDPGPGDDTRNMDYPMATIRASKVHLTRSVSGQSGRARSLPVRFLRSSDEALDEVERAAKADKAVLYIRNSVDDALDAAAALSARGLDARVFHARFALVDRLKIERCVVDTFGKKSEPEDRRRKVLIATQVVEQSLDLDFDVMVSDLAPIDLLIQRAGRLWRHERPERHERGGCPELLVMGPEPVADADEDWFIRAFPRAGYVYRDHARLWLTARTLQDAGAIESPGGLRMLIESVYGDQAEDAIPDGLTGRLFDAEGRAGAERSVATTQLLKFSKGYLRDGGMWDSDVRTPTRLNDDPQVTLRLARISGGRIEPYAHDSAADDPRLAWRLSEVNASQRRVGGEALDPAHAKAAQAAKANWSGYDTDKVLVVLDQADTVYQSWLGEVLSPHDTTPVRVELRYDRRRGLALGAASTTDSVIPADEAG